MSYRAFTKNLCIIKTAQLEKQKLGIYCKRKCAIFSPSISHIVFSVHLICALLLTPDLDRAQMRSLKRRDFFSLLFIYLYFFFVPTLLRAQVVLLRLPSFNLFHRKIFHTQGQFFLHQCLRIFFFSSIFLPSTFCLNRLLLDFSLFPSLG